MKELSIEQKAKAYDEAIERMKSWVRGEHPECFTEAQKAAEFIFPELAESEDERMIREIKRYIKEQGDKPSGLPNGTAAVDDMLSWLEKQGEQESTIIIPKFRVGDEIKTSNEESLTITKIDEKGYWSEDLFICSFEDSAKWELVGKLIDKNEPKFHEGEWLCENEPNNYARFIQILKTSNAQGKERYRISRDIRNDEDIVEVDFVEKYYHKFDVKDAKDGDVLYLQKDGKEHIIIYKGVIKERFRTFVSAYCAYNGIVDAFCFADVSRYIDIAYGGIMPATKSQRDTLLKAMADAGYTFDFEKKELKKIPNVLEECEIEHIEHGKYYYCIKDYYSGGCKRASKGEVVQALRGMSMMALGVEANEYFIPVKCIVDVSRPAWSEENEDMIRYIGNAITCKESAKYLEEKGIDMIKAHRWLESFRTQPKQEWSEEDEKTLNEIFSVAARASLRKSTLFGKSYDYIKWQNWLKSLKQRIGWKPSDEQMYWLKWAIRRMPDTEKANEAEAVLEELLEQLKKLKG